MSGFSYHTILYSNLFWLLSQSRFQEPKIQCWCTIAPCNGKTFTIVKGVLRTTPQGVLFRQVRHLEKLAADVLQFLDV